MFRLKEKSAEVIVVVETSRARREQHRRSHKAAKDQTLSRFQFSKEVQIKLASLTSNEAGCNWCAAVAFTLNEPPYTRSVLPAPNCFGVRWCVRCTSLLPSGEAVYSISGS